MLTATRERVLERVSSLGPLQNVFLLSEADDGLGGIVLWHPEIGLRELIFENDDLAMGVNDFLREVGVRRFKSWDELAEAQRKEKWQGWDTCADWQRFQRIADELAAKDINRAGKNGTE